MSISYQDLTVKILLLERLQTKLSFLSRNNLSPWILESILFFACHKTETWDFKSPKDFYFVVAIKGRQVFQMALYKENKCFEINNKK